MAHVQGLMVRAPAALTGLGAQSDGAQAGGHRHRRPGRAAERSPIEHVRVAALAADAGPPVVAAVAAKVGPLGKVGLAKDDRALLAEQRHDVRITCWARFHQRERARRRAHQISRVDVVLDEDRHPMQRTSEMPSGALRVEPIGRGERVGVDLEH